MGKDLSGKELGKGITQRKFDQRYCARYTDRFGKRIEYCNADINKVKHWLSEIKAKDTLKMNIVDSNIKLDDWYDKWINIIKADTITASTKVSYMRTYEAHIRRKIGMFKINEINNLMIKELINNMKKMGYSYDTRNAVKLILVDMFNRAMENQLVNLNPARGIKVVRDEAYEPRVLSHEEEKLFFDCAKGTFYYNMFVVAINTGMRPGELQALTWKDIDFDNELITVNKTLVYQKFDGEDSKKFHIDPPKNKFSYRNIKMTSICKQALLKQKRLHEVLINKIPFNKRDIVNKEMISLSSENKHVRPFDLVFTTKFVTPINHQIYSDNIKKIIDEINLQLDDTECLEVFTGHCFRHTAATRSYEATKDIVAVSKLLGHASTEMCSRLYVHNTDEMTRQTVEGLEKQLEYMKYDD